MTQFLPPNLLALFAPRDPIPFLPQLEKLPHEKHHNQPYSGIAPFIKHFEVHWIQIVQLSLWQECLWCTCGKITPYCSLPSIKWPLGITAGDGYHFWIDMSDKEVFSFFFRIKTLQKARNLFCLLPKPKWNEILALFKTAQLIIDDILKRTYKSWECNYPNHFPL